MTKSEDESAMSVLVADSSDEHWKWFIHFRPGKMVNSFLTITVQLLYGVDKQVWGVVRRSPPVAAGRCWSFALFVVGEKWTGVML